MPEARVVILSDYIGGDGATSGGAGHAALDSYRALSAAGADVSIIAGFGDLPTAAAAAGRAVSLGGHDLRSGGPMDAVRAIYNRDALYRLERSLECHDPQTTLLILHQWTRYLSPAALRAVDRYPTMIYMHDYFWACPNGAYYDFVRGHPCERRPMGARCLSADCDKQSRVQKLGRVARQASRIAMVHSPTRNRLFLHLSEVAERTAAPLLPGERHAVLHNPLDIAETPEPATPPPRYDVGYFGRLEPEKGVLELAGETSMLGLRGLFVGEGSLETSVASVSGMERQGWQPRAAMAGIMRDCAAVVLPSIWNETWGLIVPEAMAAGVPVIVSNHAGSAELVCRFGGGMIFDPGTAGDLRAKLMAMGRQPRPEADRRALRAFLSFDRHAQRIVMLARRHFALDLVTSGNDPRTHEALPMPRQASFPPQPR